MTYLAVPIAAKDIAGVQTQALAAKSSCADIIELRTDYLEGLDLDIAAQAITVARSVGLPIIVTCRDKAQGGAGDHSLELRRDILAAALNAGADYIDCEYENFKNITVREKLVLALTSAPRARLILSAHNFDGPWSYDTLEDMYDEIIEDFPLAIPKLVYTANHINDTFAAFDLLKRKDTDAIVLCMSQAGTISRIIAKKLGAYLTFASLDDDSATAPGQITVNQMKNLYRFDAINENTDLYGVIGSPIGHSMSPDIFNACFADGDINAAFMHLLVDGDEKDFTRFMDNVTEREYLGFSGFSVTLPHKAHAVEYVEKKGETLDALAAEIGAVNTVKIGYGELVGGYNTDCAGAIDALTSVLNIKKHALHSVSVAVIGAGGVSRAVVAGLCDLGAHVTVYNRTVEKAKGLAAEFGCKYASIEDVASLDASVVVNCTSIGMHPDVDSSPVPEGCFTSDMAVFDTVYNPLQTKMLRQAEAAGAKTVNGAEMFIRQAVAQFKIFTSKQPNEQIMRETVFNKLAD
jgi:3-dehydroquinate dehydratase/shikimate dehydrogenase